MAEINITGSVGAKPARNLPTDVQNIQSLLKSVNPPLSKTVIPTGQIDKGTLDAILEYQSRFTKKPDGRVDPNGPTLMRLNWEPTVDKDFETAIKWLDVVNRRLVSTGDADMKLKVKNVFHIEFEATGRC
jgi:hypothetical protein